MKYPVLDSGAVSAIGSFCTKFEGGRYSSPGAFTSVSDRAFALSTPRNLLMAKHWGRFSNQSKLQLAKNIFFRNRQVELPCSFHLVYRKTGIRLFDFSKGIVVKIFLESEKHSNLNDRGESLLECRDRESEGRKYAANAGVRTPEIIGVGDASLPYLVEKWVRGEAFPRHPIPENTWSKAAIEASISLSQANPPELIKAGAIPTLNSAFRLLRNNGEYLQGKYPALYEFMAGNSELMEPEALCIGAFAHGDFVPANLLRTRTGSACVLDWEAFGLAPFGYDLYTYLSHCLVSGWLGFFADRLGSWIESCGGACLEAVERFGSIAGFAPERVKQVCAVQAALAMIGFQASSQDRAQLETHLSRCTTGLIENAVVYAT